MLSIRFVLQQMDVSSWRVCTMSNLHVCIIYYLISIYSSSLREVNRFNDMKRTPNAELKRETAGTWKWFHLSLLVVRQNIQPNKKVASGQKIVIWTDMISPSYQCVSRVTFTQMQTSPIQTHVLRFISSYFIQRK